MIGHCNPSRYSQLSETRTHTAYELETSCIEHVARPCVIAHSASVRLWALAGFDRALAGHKLERASSNFVLRALPKDEVVNGSGTTQEEKGAKLSPSS